MNTEETTKKSNLTRNIFIALVLGITLGFVFNKYYVNAENTKIDFYAQQIDVYNNSLKAYLPDSTSASYKAASKSISIFENNKKNF